MRDLEPAALALISAGLRHVRDAESLSDPANTRASPDQAFHLAGYGPECLAKSTVSFRTVDKAIGHQFTSRDVVAFALSLDPAAERYGWNDWATTHAEFSEWSEQSRYLRTGTFTGAKTGALVKAARDAVDSVFFALWADGRIPSNWRPT